jgi:SAM-dependent methyltransferase
MNVSGLLFVSSQLKTEELRGRGVLEVGSLDVNGSVRPLIMNCFQPAEYVGVDMQAGKSVDVVCPAEQLVERFGGNRFEVVISMEMLEHARDWRACISNMKNVCRTGGIILMSTRSKGFRYHAYPNDFWRFEQEDMKRIFADCELLALEGDPLEPGLFLKVRKPEDFRECKLGDERIYSIMTDRRELQVEEPHFLNAHFLRLQKRLHSRERKKAWKKRRKKFFALLFGRRKE